MLLLLLSFAWASESFYDFDDDEIAGELVQPDVTAVYAADAPPSADRSPRWRERRARQLDRRLARGAESSDLVERADLYVLESRELRLLGYSALDAAWAAGEGVDADEVEELVAADLLGERALNLYERALPDLDGPAALHGAQAAATLLQDLGRADEAVAAWSRVLRIAPGHARAHVALGDAAFAVVDLMAAQEHLEAARRDDTFGRYATYKLAWVRFNQGHVEEAAELMEGIQGEDMLAREARRDAERFRGR